MQQRTREQDPVAPARAAADDWEPEDELENLIPDILSRLRESLPVTAAERRLLTMYQDPETEHGHDPDQWSGQDEEPYLETISSLERQQQY